METGHVAHTIAAREPGPAGVATSALAGALATSLMLKVLTIRDLAPELQDVTRRVVDELRIAADDDVAAVRTRDTNAMMRVPLGAVRSVLEALDVWREASKSVTKGHIAADLAATGLLLTGAARGILVCLEENLKLWPDTSIADEVATMWRAVENFANPRNTQPTESSESQ